MDLPQHQKHKMATALQVLAEKAAPNLQVKLILTLQRQASPPTNGNKRLRPADFKSRREYKKALLDQQQSLLRSELGDTLASLEELGVIKEGTNPSEVLVVEVELRKLPKILELPGVSKVKMDEEIHPLAPRRALCC